MKTQLRCGLVAIVGLLAACQSLPGHDGYLSHSPMRALPSVSERALDDGPAYYVDPVNGDDSSDGSTGKPWKTIGHAATQLKPGETLLLRGGTYYEHVAVAVSGTADKPITMRSHPGELAIIDGGMREFFENPAEAWEPVADGAEGEFRSVKSFPGLSEVLLGNFGDSMVPLHPYRHLGDLRSENQYWTLSDKTGDDEYIYCGPGLWYDSDSGHIHVRLAHTTLPHLGIDNYRGQTDPRKFPLVIAGTTTPALHIQGSKHLRIEDVVVRGSRGATVGIADSADVELDRVTVYGGSPALEVDRTNRLRIVHSSLRGIAAPWSSRSSMKYRGVPAYLLMARALRGEDVEQADAAGLPHNRDFEIAHCELTDGHDGPFVGTIRGLRFHHNLVDNFNDDGVYLTAMGVGGDVRIYQNRISRCLHAFSFYGDYPTGSGVYIFRNLIDQRSPVPYQWPSNPDDPSFPPAKADEGANSPTSGWLCGDHGSPIWEPIYFYHNTVVMKDAAFRDYYGLGWGGHTAKTTRRVFNNIFVQIGGRPGLVFENPSDDVQADGNLLWGAGGVNEEGDFAASFQRASLLSESKKAFAAARGANDLAADPQFVSLAADWKDLADVRLRSGSPAIDAGVAIPAEWPDPLRDRDRAEPDMGALPLGADPLRVGPAKEPAQR